VEYYAILQRLTPAEERPIVRRLPFAEQRSPGYSIMSLGPYLVFFTLVQPFVETKRIVETSAGQAHSSPDSLPSQTGPGVPSSTRGAGSEYMLIPPKPLLLRDVPFRDYYVSEEGSWFQWKIALSLAATSYLFLFLGLAANAWTQRKACTGICGVSLSAISVFTSALFLHNIVVTPLYSTLTAYSLASLFALFFVGAHRTQAIWQMLLAGFSLGLLVLTRLELTVVALAVVLFLMLRPQWASPLT
jgi:hypothetical protein